jgi:SAM-dependent methyltransferase
MSFLEQSVPERFAVVLKNLEAANPAITTLRWMLGSSNFYEWAVSIGVSTYSGLRDASSPIPPMSLRSIVAAPEEEIFLWSGARDISNFMAIFYEYWNQSTPARIFDFGCGCGRMSRFLNGARGIIPFASDINANHVAWCVTNLESVTTRLNHSTPPLPFEDGNFDFAYSLSIFTHLDERIAVSWLKDLSRVLATGGILILTTHGYAALETIKTSEVHQRMFEMTPEVHAKLSHELAAKKYVYFPLSEAIVRAANAGPSYGHTFMHPSYAEENWNQHGLSLLRHIPGGVRGWQDIFVLRKE